MLPIIKNALLGLGYGVLSFSKQHLPTRHVPPLPCTSAMSPNGRWEVTDTNDMLVYRLKPPVVVTIIPDGFSIGKGIFGSFRVEPLHSHSKSGVYVSMCLFNIPLLKKVYLLEPLGVERIALFGTGSMATTYYILRRLHQNGSDT